MMDALRSRHLFKVVKHPDGKVHDVHHTTHGNGDVALEDAARASAAHVGTHVDGSPYEGTAHYTPLPLPIQPELQIQPPQFETQPWVLELCADVVNGRS
jgi:hypothetical protein